MPVVNFDLSSGIGDRVEDRRGQASSELGGVSVELGSMSSASAVRPEA